MLNGFGLVALMLVTSCAGDGPTPGEAQAAKSALITGVPFVSFEEASKFVHKNPFENGTHLANHATLIRYWGHETGQDLDKARLEAFGDRDAGTKGWANVVEKEGATTDDIKGYLDRGIPVMVPMSLTPDAHYLNVPILVMLQMNSRKDLMPAEGMASGFLGSRLCSLEYFRKLEKANIFSDIEVIGGPKGMKPPKINPIRESALDVFRVVVGYSDERQAFTLMDSCYGPGWEVPYVDFSRMWNAMGSNLTAFEAGSGQPAPAMREEPYRERTIDERSAEWYHRAYGLASIGKEKEARKAYEAMHELPQLGDFYHHLVHLELGVMESRHRRLKEAVAELEESQRLCPDDYGVVEALHYLNTALKDKEKAKVAKERMEAIKKDPTSGDRYGASTPRNLPVWRGQG